MRPTAPRDIPAPNSHDNRPAPVAVTVADASRLSGLGRTTLYELVAEGSLPLAKVGRRSLIPYEALQRLIASRIVSRAA